jgi:hypothetical protein
MQAQGRAEEARKYLIRAVRHGSETAAMELQHLVLASTDVNPVPPATEI